MSTERSKKQSKSRTRKENPILPDIRIGIEGQDYTLSRLEKMQGEKSIYKLEYELSKHQLCTNYIDDANKHVVFKDKDGEYIILKLPTTRGSPINTNIIEKCAAALAKKRMIGNKNIQLIKDAILIQACAPEIKLSEAQDTLGDLNNDLRKPCPRLHFKLAPYYEYLEPLQRYGEHGHVCIGCQYYNTLILALCNDERCISSIELVMREGGEILINSKTDEAEEGKKYNKLLRAVLSIVAHKIPGIEYFKSTAINPVSAWLLLQYSNARIEDGDPFIEFLHSQKVTKELIQEYYAREKNVQIKLIVDLNAANAAHAHKQFKKMIHEDEIKCA
jgi:hypothetical protein